MSANYRIDFSNYRISSHTLIRSQDVSLEIDTLNHAHHRLKKMNTEFGTLSRSDLYMLNQEILRASTAMRRTETIHEPYRFPDPEQIDQGMETLVTFMRESTAHELVKQVALMQGLLSLHPFADGNHRTSRMLLDNALCRIGFPPTTCLKTTDLVFANPVGEKVFSLADAVQAVLHAIGETITHSNQKTRA